MGSREGNLGPRGWGGGGDSVKQEAGKKGRGRGMRGRKTLSTNERNEIKKSKNCRKMKR